MLMAHELGHATLPSGFGAPYEVVNPDLARDRVRLNEGTALVGEYVVSMQLGIKLYSDRNVNGIPVLKPLLDSKFSESGIDVGSVKFGSSEWSSLFKQSSVPVGAAGEWNGASNPSSAKHLTYDSYSSAWWVMMACFGSDKANSVVWGDVALGQISWKTNADGTYSVSGQNVPLMATGKDPVVTEYLSLECELLPSGRPYGVLIYAIGDKVRPFNSLKMLVGIDGAVTLKSSVFESLISTGQGSLVYAGFDAAGNIIMRYAKDGALGKKAMFYFDRQGVASIGFDGNSMMRIPEGASISVSESAVLFGLKAGGLTGAISVTDRTSQATWRNADGTFSVEFNSSATSSGDPVKWTQNGKTATGGDLADFIARTSQEAMAVISAAESQAVASRDSAKMSAVAVGVTDSRSNASSSRYLATRIAYGDVSDKWLPMVLGGQITDGLYLAANQNGAIQQALASISQQRWQVRDPSSSIFTVRVFDAIHPLVLDLSGRGIQLIAPWQSDANFDLHANGQKKRVGWVGGDSGIFVFDKNGNGIIDSAAEWFGESFSADGTVPPKNQNGFAALATLVNAGATVFSRDTAKIDPTTGKSYFDLVQIWVDANQDGITDKGELRSLSQLSIASIDLQSAVDGRQINGGEIALTAGYTKDDGSRGVIADVGLVDATGQSPSSATWMPVTAALVFAEYASRGYAALSKGQAQGILAALAANNIDVSGAIDALQSRMSTDRVLFSGGYASPLIKVRDRTQITMYQDGHAETQIVNNSGVAALSLLQDASAFATRASNVASSVVAGTDSILLAQKDAQVANATGTAAARTQADGSANAAATAWGRAIADYLGTGLTSAQLTARMESLRLSLNALVPVNGSATGHLPGGYTYFSPGDASLAAEAFDGYAGAVQLLGNTKIALDSLLAAMAQSAGYTRAYLGQTGGTVTVTDGFNLLLAGNGVQTFALGANVDHVALSTASGTVMLQGFQVGATGDQLQFLGVGSSVSIRSIAGGIQIMSGDGLRYANLMGVSADKLDLFANITGVSEISFADFSLAGTRSIEGVRLYDGQVHIRKITASNFGDTLIGDSEATTLVGGRGDDTFIVTGRGYQIDGGLGEDRVSYAKQSEGVTVNLKTGTDSLGSSLFQIEQLIGTDYRDTLTGDMHNNVFDGGKGYDTIEGGGGNDVYLFGRGGGVDTLVNGIAANGGPSSVLRLKAGISGDQLWLSRDGNHLVVTILGASDRVIVSDWFAYDYRKLGAIELASGERLDLASIERLVTTLAAYQQAHTDFDPRSAQMLPDGISLASSFSSQVSVPQVPQASNVALEVKRAVDGGRATSGAASANSAVSSVNGNWNVVANASASARSIWTQVSPIGIPAGTHLYSYQTTLMSETVVALSNRNFASGDPVWGKPADVTSWRELGGMESDRIYFTRSFTSSRPVSTSTNIIEWRTPSVQRDMLADADVIAANIGAVSASGQTIGSAASARQQALVTANQANNAPGTATSAQARSSALAFEQGLANAIAAYQALAGNVSQIAAAVSRNASRLGGIMPAGSNWSEQVWIPENLVTHAPGYWLTVNYSIGFSFYSSVDEAKYNALVNMQAVGQSAYAAAAAAMDTLRAVFGTMGDWSSAQIVSAGGSAIASAGGDLLVSTGGGAHSMTGGSARDTFAFVGTTGAANDTVNSFQTGANGDRVLIVPNGTRTVYLGENSAGALRLAFATGSGATGTVQLTGVNYRDFSLYDNLRGIETADFRDMAHGVNVALTSVTPRDADGFTHVRNLTGTAFADALVGDARDNILMGGAGDDLLMGGIGNDTYIWRKGDGNDTIREQDQGMTPGNTDVLKLVDVNTEDVGFSRRGDDLLVKILSTNELITIQDQYGSVDQRVEVVEFANGSQRLLPVANTPPTGIVQIKRGTDVVSSGGSLMQGDVLSTTHNLVDPDGLGAMRYQWFADGVAIGGATSTTFVLSQTEVGKQISVRLEYTDGLGTVESVGSAQTPVVINKNDAPVGVVTISGSVVEGQTLRASHNLTDADGMGVARYQWYADGVAIDGATSDTLLLTERQGNRKITVTANYIDGFGTAESVSSAPTVAVAHLNRAPSGTVGMQLNGVSVDSATVLKQGDVLNAINSLTDLDGMGVVSYRWYADGQLIVGATGNQLTLAQAQVGKRISVKAEYVDGFGTREQVESAHSSSVLNVNDAPVGDITILGSPTFAAKLSVAQNFTDVDGVGTLSYQWYADGVLLAGKNAATLDLTLNLIGKAITVSVSYVDGFGTTESLISRATQPVQRGFAGTSGNDIIYGTAGADVMVGLDGDDTYYVNHEGDVVIEAPNEGRDTVYVSIKNYTLPENVESGRLTANGATLIGNQLQNSFIVESAGGNKLIGGGGQNDVVSYIFAKSGVIATMLGDEDWDFPTKPSGDVLEGMRNLVGSNYNDVLTGDNADNLISGAAGDDILWGRGGADLLVGGQGSDTYLFGRGDGADRITEIYNPQDTNVVSFLEGIKRDQLWFKRVDNNLEISIIGTQDTLTINGWYGGNGWPIQQFRTADNYVLRGEQVFSLADAMSQLPPPSGTELPPEYESFLSTTISSVWRKNAAPTGSLTIVGSPIVGKMLELRDFISDSDGINSYTRRYQWYADDIPIQGMTGIGFIVDSSLVGKAISVQVNYKDGNGVAESVRSAVTFPVIAGASSATIQATPAATSNFSVEQLIQAMSSFAPETGGRSDLVPMQQDRQDIRLAVAH